MNLLAIDLRINSGARYTFMSDQQKGFLAAVREVFLEAETKVCARHVYTNFRTVFSGSMEYRKQFWIIVKSTTENESNAQMEVMRLLSAAAAEDLLNRNYIGSGVELSIVPCHVVIVLPTTCQKLSMLTSSTAGISQSLQCLKILERN